MSCAVLVVIFWLLYGDKKWTSNILNTGFLALMFAMLVSCLAGPCINRGLNVIDKYYKFLFIYILIVTTVRKEPALRSAVKGFLAVNAIYTAHSVREFMAGS